MDNITDDVLLSDIGRSSIYLRPPSLSTSDIPLPWPDWLCIKCHFITIAYKDTFATAQEDRWSRQQNFFFLQNPGCLNTSAHTKPASHKRQVEVSSNFARGMFEVLQKEITWLGLTSWSVGWFCEMMVM